jgi:GTP pyrophosphokinase
MNHAAMTEIDIEKRTKQLLRNTKNYCASVVTLTPEDKKLIRKAFDVSVEAHKEQRRKSGKPIYFTLLPSIAFRNRSGCNSIAAALLHDVVEDTYDR